MNECVLHGLDWKLAANVALNDSNRCFESFLCLHHTYTHIYRITTLNLPPCRCMYPSHLERTHTHTDFIGANFAWLHN